MTIAPKNLLILLSDEHQRDVTGAYGNPLIRTPNMDALAARGTLFTDAYTPCPICVPARAAIATGRHVHQTRAWDNAMPYHGEIPSWHHRLRDNGQTAISIGKLHFRSTDDDNGFTEEILPLHVLNGIGDLLGMLRDPPAPRGGMPALARDAGAGPASYNDYDIDITEKACDWLRTRAAREKKPWTLLVSWVRPHFPLIAPEEFFRLYPPETMPMPRLRDGLPDHPAMRAFRQCMNYDDYFDEDSTRRALAAYYALVSFLDDNIGKVLRTLDEAGLTQTTRVIYTSDHGDNLGNRGYWGKSVMYEESVAVPLILAGPDVPQGAVVRTPVSLVDLYRTALEGTGCPVPPEDESLPSYSLWDIARGAEPDRTVLSEYHAVASITGTFMIRHGKWKYIHHAGYRPELFDLEADPGETRDLAGDPAFAGVLAECEAALRRILDPDSVTAAAFADQAKKIAEHGGREAILARGDFGYTPAPGETPAFA